MLSTVLVGTGRPAVAYLHGLFGRGKNWNGVARAVAAQGWSGVLFDLPNHGRSSWTDTVDYEETADLVAEEIVEKLGSAARLCLVGHSMGGKVAMLIALRHPQLVASLVVVDIAPGHSEQVVTSVPLVAAMRELDLAATPDRSSADRSLATRVDDPAVRQFLLQNLKLLREPDASGARWHWETNLKLLGDSLDDVADWPDPTGSYTGPVLWLAGANSPYIRLEHHAGMQRLFPRVELVTVPGAGHWVHADQPVLVAEALTEFLGRVDP